MGHVLLNQLKVERQRTLSLDPTLLIFMEPVYTLPEMMDLSPLRVLELVRCNACPFIVLLLRDVTAFVLYFVR